MDVTSIQTPLIFVALFVLACLLLFFVYKIGVKEKSYEEALAEQRQNSQVLLGTKEKPKEKKNKKVKTAKKTKEKQPTEEKQSTEQKQSTEEKQSNETDASENQEIDHSAVQEKRHVEFKETQEYNKKPEKDVKKKLKNKITPVVVEKEIIVEENSQKEQPNEVTATNKKVKPHKASPAQVQEEVLSNVHKDLTVSSVAIEDLPVKELPKEKVINVKSQNLINSKKSSLTQILQPVDSTESLGRKQVEAVNLSPITNGYIINVGKEKKKKKSEFNTLQQLSAADKEGPNMSLLLNLVRKAEMSRSDVQILIDLLLNKQHEAPAIVDEWSEGRFDPVQRLKKQLAEKEKALLDQQETLSGVQIKMKEIRNEQQSERSSLQQKVRGLEEILQAKQIEAQANNNRFLVQTQTLQQIQAQLNDERVKNQNLREELGNLQIHQQQIQMEIGEKAEVQLAQLRAELHGCSEQNGQYLIQIQHYQKEAADRDASYVAKLNTYTKELDVKSRHIEDLSVDSAQKTEILKKQENDFNTELTKLKTAIQQQTEEVKRNELNRGQTQEEIKTLQKQHDEANKIIAQLKLEIQKLEDEKPPTNGSTEDHKLYETQILNLHNELSSVKNQLQHSENKYNKELTATNVTVHKLQDELEQQKVKNNELRSKNHKVMEALNEAENRIKITPVGPTKEDIEKIRTDVQKAEQHSQKEFIIRLFPEVGGLKDIAEDNWDEESGKLIRNHLEELKKEQTKSESEKSENDSKLLVQLQHYQAIIDDTEGMLNKLQAHIEQEELNWRDQLKAKDLELELLKEQQVKQDRQGKLDHLKSNDIVSNNNHNCVSTNGASTDG